MILLLFCWAGAEAADDPILVRESGLWLRLPPGLLHIPEVREHVTSGLTTTLQVRYRVIFADNGELNGLIRVDIRFEPWDEVFHLQIGQTAQPPVRRRLSGRDALLAWWQEQSWPLAAGNDPRHRERGTVKLELVLIPFSQSEQEEALRSITSPGRFQEASETVAEEGGNTDIIDLILFTAAKRKAAFRFRWTLRF